MPRRSQRRNKRTPKPRSTWKNDKFIFRRCRCRKFTVEREPVARKVHRRKSRRKRIVAICCHGYKARIAFLS